MRGSAALRAGWLAAAVAAVLTSGCASGLSTMAPTQLGYQHSNAIMSSGFSETTIAPDHYRIEVTGYPNTSRERLEKIAATRAAEIGSENRLGYFKITGFEHSSRCQKFIAGGQRAGSGAAERKLSFTVLTADVVYAKQPPDPSYIEAKTAFDQYRAELDADTTPVAPLDPTAGACT